MSLYISYPVIQLSENKNISCRKELYSNDDYYLNVYKNIIEVFGKEINKNNNQNKKNNLSIYELKSEFISRTWSSIVDVTPSFLVKYDYIFDCYNGVSIEGPSAVYAIAKKTGNIFSKPVALGNQGGNELAQCLKILMGNFEFENALCIGSQILSPFYNMNIGRRILGDGVALLAATKKKVVNMSEFEILSVEIGRINSIDDNGFANWIESVLLKQNFEIDWIVCNNYQEIIQFLNKDYSNKLLVRESYMDIDFGVVDDFVTLNDSNVKRKVNMLSHGMVCHIGQEGSVSCILLKKI